MVRQKSCRLEQNKCKDTAGMTKYLTCIRNLFLSRTFVEGCLNRTLVVGSFCCADLMILATNHVANQIFTQQLHVLRFNAIFNLRPKFTSSVCVTYDAGKLTDSEPGKSLAASSWRLMRICSGILYETHSRCKTAVQRVWEKSGESKWLNTLIRLENSNTKRPNWRHNYKAYEENIPRQDLFEEQVTWGAL